MDGTQLTSVNTPDDDIDDREFLYLKHTSLTSVNPPDDDRECTRLSPLSTLSHNRECTRLSPLSTLSHNRGKPVCLKDKSRGKSFLCLKDKSMNEGQ